MANVYADYLFINQIPADEFHSFISKAGDLLMIKENIVDSSKVFFFFGASLATFVFEVDGSFYRTTTPFIDGHIFYGLAGQMPTCQLLATITGLLTQDNFPME